MKRQNNSWIEDELIDMDGIPVTAAVTPLKPHSYGTIDGLDIDELADPEELERQVYREMMGTILRLPYKFNWSGPKPEIDENGDVEWGAFGSIDFLRDRPAFLNKARYKRDCLKEQLKDQIILIDMIKSRLKGKPYALVLKYLDMGIIDMDHIEDFWMRRLVMRYYRAKKLKDDIRCLCNRLYRGGDPK